MTYPTVEQVDRFVKKITAKNIRPPSSGDCWHCLMRTQSGQTLGDATGNVDHLISHVREGYVHGSLIANAYFDAGHNKYFLSMVFSRPAEYVDWTRRIVKKYLLKTFRKAAAKDQSEKKRMIVVNARGKTPKITARKAKYTGGKRCHK